MSLITRAQEIKNETADSENTAARVGGLLEDIVNELYLDASFSGNTTAQTVGTSWQDLNTNFTVHYSKLVSWDGATNSFEYTGVRDRPEKIVFHSYVESAANNEDFEFAIFTDTGSGFTMLGAAFPYSFRTADNTEVIAVGNRFEIETGTKFKMQVRKPSGSSDLTFLSSKVLI